MGKLSERLKNGKFKVDLLLLFYLFSIAAFFKTQYIMGIGLLICAVATTVLAGYLSNGEATSKLAIIPFTIWALTASIFYFEAIPEEYRGILFIGSLATLWLSLTIFEKRNYAGEKHSESQELT